MFDSWVSQEANSVPILLQKSVGCRLLRKRFLPRRSFGECVPGSGVYVMMVGDGRRYLRCFPSLLARSWARVSGGICDSSYLCSVIGWWTLTEFCSSTESCLYCWSVSKQSDELWWPRWKDGHYSMSGSEYELWLCPKLWTYIQTIRNSFKVVFKHRQEHAISCGNLLSSWYLCRSNLREFCYLRYHDTCRLLIWAGYWLFPGSPVLGQGYGHWEELWYCSSELLGHH